MNTFLGAVAITLSLSSCAGEAVRIASHSEEADRTYRTGDGMLEFTTPVSWRIADDWPDGAITLTNFVLGGCCALSGDQLKIDVFLDRSAAPSRVCGPHRACRTTAGRSWAWTYAEDATEGLVTTVTARTVVGSGILAVVAYVPSGRNSEAGRAEVESIIRTFRVH